MTQSQNHVVIIGAGFGGIEVARGLGAAGIPTTLIDRHNHHLFQPLLYQVATAALSPADIAEPVRKVLRGYESVEVLLDEAVAIGGASVSLASGNTVAYDWLVVATGAMHSYFGHDDWRRSRRG
jgi:NADH dehydrogenase